MSKLRNNWNCFKDWICDCVDECNSKIFCLLCMSVHAHCIQLVILFTLHDELFPFFLFLLGFRAMMCVAYFVTGQGDGCRTADARTYWRRQLSTSMIMWRSAQPTSSHPSITPEEAYDYDEMLCQQSLTYQTLQRKLHQGGPWSGSMMLLSGQLKRVSVSVTEDLSVCDQLVK